MKKKRVLNENHPLWIDYHDRLSPEDKKFLFKFSAEFHLGIFRGERLHSAEQQRELARGRNAARRDVTALSAGSPEATKPRRGRYSERDYRGDHDEQVSPEDKIIECLDLSKHGA